MRDGGLIELGRHHLDIVGQRARVFLDDLEAGGMDAVVIGAENSHPFQCLLIGSRTVNAPSYPSRAVEANPANSVKWPALTNPAVSAVPIWNRLFFGRLMPW